jgi:hypothetical protein
MAVRPYNPTQPPDDPNQLKEHRDQEARAIQASIKSAKDTTDTLTTNLGTTNTNVTNLTTRVTTAEGNITTAQGNITTHTGQITTLQTTVGELSGRNRIINGDFRVAQYFNASVSLASNYVLDRWIGQSTGAAATASWGGVNGNRRLVVTGIAGNTGVYIGQRIEQANSSDLAGQSVIIQIKASSSALTNLNWALYYPTAADNFASNTLISSGSWTISATEAIYTATISVPSAANTGLYLLFSTGALLATQTLTISDVQLEYGTIATRFEKFPYGYQLQLCQRYWQQTYQNVTQYAGAGAGVVWTNNIQSMRTTPVLTRSSESQSNFALASGYPQTGTNYVVTYGTLGSAGSCQYVAVWTLNAEL